MMKKAGNMIPTLHIVRGLPGSGKSTFAYDLEGVHLEADMYFMDESGKYNFEKEKLHQAHQWCLTTARVLLLQGYDVVVSNTFTTMKEMQPYLDLVEKLHCSFIVTRMTGNWGSIHNVPEETLERMRQRFQDYEGEVLR